MMLWILIIIILLVLLVSLFVLSYFIGFKIAETRYSKIIFYGSLFCSLIGLIFNFMLGGYQISFVNNSIDLLVIFSFLVSVIYLEAYGIKKHYFLKDIRVLLYIGTTSIFIFLFAFFYTPTMMVMMGLKTSNLTTEVGSFIIRESDLQ